MSLTYVSSAIANAGDPYLIMMELRQYALLYQDYCYCINLFDVAYSDM